MALKLEGEVKKQWKFFDLPVVQREMDTEAAEVARRQDESEAARKQLIEQSREFKKSASEETKNQVAPLLKSFQAEIDKLSQRSKAAEMTFLGLYKKLTDVTDPVPYLDMIGNLQSKVIRLQDVELEVKQLRDTLAEYNEEFRQVRNQEVTIKQLKEKARLAEEGLEQAVQSRLEEREAELKSQFEERERELIELNQLTVRRMTDSDSKCTALQNTVTELQSELFDAKAGAELISQAKLDEIEILLQDLDRSNQRAVLAEKELSVLKEQFEESSKRLSTDQANEAPPPIMDTPLDVMGRPSLLELAAKEKEVQTLIEDVQKLQSTLNQLRESSARQLSHFEEELQTRSKHIQRLEAQLEAQKDYQEIRRELSILKSIEFPSHHPSIDDEDVKKEKSTNVQSSGTNKPLEVLLLERNKALQSENTALKVANSELQEEDPSTTRPVAPLEETSPPSPPPSSSSSASPGPAVSTTAPVEGTDKDMPASTRISLSSPSSMAAAAAAAAAASASASVGPPPPFSPFVSPRHMPPVFHPVLGLGQLGHFFNEDMLLHWRRSLEASMLSHHQQQAAAAAQHHHRNSTSPARPSSPGGASSDNGAEENSSRSLFTGHRTPTAETGSSAPAPSATPTPNSQHQQVSSNPSAATLPGWPSWEDSHLARLQQEFIARGGVYPGFGGPGQPGSNEMGGGGGGPDPAALASLMSLPEGLTSLLAKSNPLEARLQEMLRATMERYANQVLDTLAISRGVRELLSMHNIGQRLFAKFVLGLSQGTVSELLSKPKPWDKLTEKGRDSYRKMHAWACDEAAILLLKSLIPRKGKETGSSSLPSTKTEESSVTEERIAHILHEASAALRAQQVDVESGSDESKSPSQAQTPSPGPKVEPCSSTPTTPCATTTTTTATATTPVSSSSNNNNNNNSSQRRGRKPDHDDISQEQVLRIYHDELAKMMSGNSSSFNPAAFNPALLTGARSMASNLRDYNRSYTSALFERTPEEIRLALDVYQQELNRLMQPPTSSASAGPFPGFGNPTIPVSGSNGFPQDLSLPKSSGGRSDEEGSERDTKVSSARTPSSTKSLLMDVNGERKTPSSTAAESTSVTVKTENQMAYMPHSLHNILRPSSSPSPDESNSTTGGGPGSCSGPAGGSNAGVASPLQRIASITNSLMSQPSNPTLPQVTQRPMKAILPPITQQQFDTYQNLNTEDIVKKVKEQLSQYSISQRLFGESVLGLSQGSVSDLLARPKPWHMLTQKGREPFIRMKIFLEDENAVHKLVASQYKIAPEKLMRTGGYSGSPQSAALKNVAKMMTPSSHSTTLPANSGGTSGTMDLSPNSLAHSALALHHAGLRGPGSMNHGSHPLDHLSSSGRTSPCGPSGLNYGATLAHFMSMPSGLGQRGLPPHLQHLQQQHLSASTPTSIKSEKSSSAGKALPTPNQNSTPNGLTHSPMDDSSTPTPGQGIPTLAAYSLPAHSVYELAALTQDLDTQGMTTKIKEVLLANNIGQKIFGEAVLGLSQGSVSELLSKPKPWHMLSIKGREPFIRMQLWLSDPRNIEHIQRLKSERREAGKRRRDIGFPLGDAAPNSNASSNTNSFMGGDNSSNDGSVDGSPSPFGGARNQLQEHPSLTTGAGTSLNSSSPSPAKKQRILFSEHQKEALKLAFSLDPYPSTSAMEFLAQELNLSTRTITNWFHNHRMRLKQQQSNSSDCSKDEISTPTINGRESSGQFDPIHFRLLFHQRLFEMQASGEEGSGGNGGSGIGGLPASLAGLPSQLAGNLNMMASLGMPYPFYATGMLSQFCMGLGNPSPDQAPGAEGLDLTLARHQRAALGQSDSDAEESDCESDTSSRAGDAERPRTTMRPPIKHASPLAMITSGKVSSIGSNNHSQDGSGQQARSSRRSRKPAAPQWVNPHWQQSPAGREQERVEADRVSGDEEQDDAGQREKKRSKVDANLNNCVETDAAALSDDNDEDEEDGTGSEKINGKMTVNQPARSPTSTASSDVAEKMDDDSAKEDDDDNEQQ